MTSTRFSLLARRHRAALLGIALLAAGLQCATIAPASAASSLSLPRPVYAGYYINVTPHAPISTLVVTYTVHCASSCSERPIIGYYTVHPIGNRGDWGARQTGDVSPSSAQPLSVTFASPCTPRLCRPLSITTLTLTTTNTGVHATIVTRVFGLTYVSQEDLTSLSSF